jgi:hypothetical protein
MDSARELVIAWLARTPVRLRIEFGFPRLDTASDVPTAGPSPEEVPSPGSQRIVARTPETVKRNPVV